MEKESISSSFLGLEHGITGNDKPLAANITIVLNSGKKTYRAGVFSLDMLASFERSE